MTLEEQYKKETNLEAYELDTLNNGYDNFKYMKWLEAKINYTHSCESDSELLFDFIKWFNNYCTVDVKPNKEDVELYLSK